MEGRGDGTRVTAGHEAVGADAARTVRRRGLIAGAAMLALGAAVAGAGEPEQVAAATGGAMLIGTGNVPTASTDTTVLLTPGTVLATTLARFDNYANFTYAQPSGSRVGLAGHASAAGATGTGDTTAQLIGLYGSINSAGSSLSAGVYGTSDSAGSGVSGTYGAGAPAPYLRGGVAGTAPNGGQGVTGTCNGTGGWGVYGRSDAGLGVYGSSDSGRGVQGASSSGYGVYGTSASNIGVYGEAPQFGVVGHATSAGGYGIYGLANVDGSTGFAGGTNNANAYAAVFGGRVVIGDGGPGVPGGLIVNGSLGITGTKSAIVPDGSGGHRLMYCVESPESWFEDFGEGTIVGGKAEVKLAADFASTVDTSSMHVFPVSHDEHHTLHVAGKSAAGFTIGAVPSTTGAAAGKKATDLSGTFSYRVVAKRKDVEAPRLAKIELPKVKVNVNTVPLSKAGPGMEKKPDNTGTLPALVPSPGDDKKR